MLEKLVGKMPELWLDKTRPGSLWVLRVPRWPVLQSESKIARGNVTLRGRRLQRKFLIAFASSLLVTPSLVGQQKFTGRPLVQSPVLSPVASSPVPLPPEQMPALPPEVQFHQGQLTIRASNSTLGDILWAVRKETGASVDVLGNATERVVGQFGPGPARDVLASLLNGSHFNYVLLGSAENPATLDRVILTSRSGANDQLVQTASASPQNQPNQADDGPAGGLPPAIRAANARAIAARSIQQQADTQDMSSDDSAPDAPDSADADEQGTPGQADNQPQQPNPFGQPGAVKTPEQLLQELQQRQQQMQQQGVPNAPGYPPTPGLPR